ncbi:hypothetical protein Goe27_01400 [Bacillus phage vB_BsuM-Goe27]|nr:hypothetical protein Goe7_c01410 [Bacillus phage vB_BveM-Goe7]WCS70018.1 hypothetical protein Goe27_01400 [Bacillus phage vB_BsuM-Goe27]
MSLLKQHIVEVHDTKKYTKGWVNKYPDKKFLEIDHTIDCWGHVQRITGVFEEKEWETALENGYYMG